MGKFEQLRRDFGANIAESAGQGIAPGQAPPGMDPARTQGMPERLKGLAKSKNAAEIPLDRIDRDPTQPREEFDGESLERLADSIKRRGLLQPVRVRWSEPDGKYLLIAGERRWRAARMAGLASITCVVHEGPLDDGERLALQVVENALREDLRPIEQARAYKRLLDLNGWSTRQLATELNLAASTVSKALALLELPEPVQDQVEQGGLAPSAAYQIAQIPDPAVQAELAKRAVTEKLTYGQVEAVVRAKKAGTSESRQRPTRFEFDSDLGRVAASPRRPQDLIDLLHAALAQAEAQIVAEANDEVQAA